MVKASAVGAALLSLAAGVSAGPSYKPLPNFVRKCENSESALRGPSNEGTYVLGAIEDTKCENLGDVCCGTEASSVFDDAGKSSSAIQGAQWPHYLADGHKSDRTWNKQSTENCAATTATSMNYMLVDFGKTRWIQNVVVYGRDPASLNFGGYDYSVLADISILPLDVRVCQNRLAGDPFTDAEWDNCARCGDPITNLGDADGVYEIWCGDDKLEGRYLYLKQDVSLDVIGGGGTSSGGKRSLASGNSWGPVFTGDPHFVVCEVEAFGPHKPKGHVLPFPNLDDVKHPRNDECKQAQALKTELPPVFISEVDIGSKWLDGSYPLITKNMLEMTVIVPGMASRNVDAIIFDGTHADRGNGRFGYKDSSRSSADKKCNWYGKHTSLYPSVKHWSPWQVKKIDEEDLFDNDAVLRNGEGVDLTANPNAENMLGMGTASEPRDSCYAAAFRSRIAFDKLGGDGGCGFLRCMMVPANDNDPVVLGSRRWEVSPDVWEDAPDAKRECVYFGTDGNLPISAKETRDAKGLLRYNFDTLQADREGGTVRDAWRYFNEFTFYYTDRYAPTLRNMNANERWAEVRFRIAVYLPKHLDAQSDIRTYAAVRLLAAVTHTTYNTMDRTLALDFATDFQFPFTVDRTWDPYAAGVSWAYPGGQEGDSGSLSDGEQDGMFLDVDETEFTTAGMVLNNMVPVWFNMATRFTGSNQGGQDSASDCALTGADRDSNCQQNWHFDLQFRSEQHYRMFCHVTNFNSDQVSLHKGTLNGIYAFRYRLQCRQDGTQVTGPVGTATCPLDWDKTNDQCDFSWPVGSFNGPDTHFDTSNDASVPSRCGGLKINLMQENICDVFKAVNEEPVRLEQGTWADEGVCGAPMNPGSCTDRQSDSDIWVADHRKVAFLPQQKMHVRVDAFSPSAPLSRITLWKACAGYTYSDVAAGTSSGPTGVSCEQCGKGPLTSDGTCGLLFDRDNHNMVNDFGAHAACSSTGGITCTGADSGFAYSANSDDRRDWLTWRITSLRLGSKDGHIKTGQNVFSTDTIEQHYSASTMNGGSGLPDGANADDSRLYELGSVVEIWYRDGFAPEADINDVSSSETASSPNPNRRLMAVKHKRVLQAGGANTLAGKSTVSFGSSNAGTATATGTTSTTTAATGSSASSSTAGTGAASTASSGSSAMIVGVGVAAVAVAAVAAAIVAVVMRRRRAAGAALPSAKATKAPEALDPVVA